MFKKNLITMGLVSAMGGASSAMAVDLDDATPTPDEFASDALSATATTSSGDFLAVDTGVNGILNTTELGVGVASGDQIFIRVDLTNAVWDGILTKSDLLVTAIAVNPAGTSTTTTTTTSMTTSTTTMGSTVNNTNINTNTNTNTMTSTTTTSIATQGADSVAKGGTNEGSFAIFSMTAATELSQLSLVTVSPSSFGAVGNASANVTMSIYESLTQADNQTEDPLYSISGAFATFGSNVVVESTDETPIAAVSTNFTAFVDGTGTSDTASVGTIAFDDNGFLVGGTASTDVSGSVDLSGSSITVSGDFSFGLWTIDTDCDGVDAIDLTVAEDALSAATAVDISSLTEGAEYDVCVTADGEEEIQPGAYTATFNWEAVGTAFPLESSSVNLGAIDRNGTTVQLPYLTTFEGYNQRLVMVNRSANDAPYSISFTSEDGVTATAGAAAEGVIPAGEVLSVRVADIVTLSGRTRTAGTLVVVAPSTSVDVATNQVNISDSATDTVILN